MTVPTTHELAELAARVRQLEDEKKTAFQFSEDSNEKYLEYQIVLRRWAMASNHLGDRIRDYIESSATGTVRP